LADVSADSHHLMSSLARFYSVVARGTLGELVIPEARALSVGSAAETVASSEISYRNITIGGLDNGVLALQQAGPVIFTRRDQDGGTFQLTIDEFSIDQMDLATFAHVFDPGEYRDGRSDETWRLLAARLHYGGISVQGSDGGRLSLDEVALERIDARQPPEPLSREWDPLLDPAAPTDERDQRAVEAIASLYSALRVGAITMSGLSAEAPGQSSSFALGRLAVSDFSQDAIGSVSLDALQGESPAGFFSVGTLELAGFAFPDLEALLAFAAVEKDAKPSAHAATMNAAFGGLPRLDHFEMKEVIAGKVSAEPIRIGALTLDFDKWNDAFAEETDLRIEGLSIPSQLVELDAETEQFLQTLELEEPVLEVSFSDRWSPESGRDEGAFTFGIENAAELEFSYLLTGVTLDWMLEATAAAAKTDDSGAALTAMLDDLKLARIELRVGDRSLLDRAFTVAAKKQGLTIEGAAYRQQMSAALPFLLATVAPPELAKKLSGPLKDFLAGGRKLIAVAAPAAPLPLMDLIAAAVDPIGLIDLVNLTLTSEPVQ
jgi:hypothetical protein